MNREDDKTLQENWRAALQQADDDLPDDIQSRLTVVRQQAVRQARLAEGNSVGGKRAHRLGWAGGALAAACLLALLWLPLVTPPDPLLPVSALGAEHVAADMPLLLDSDFALLAAADVDLGADETMAFYAWVAQSDAAQSDAEFMPSAEPLTEHDVGS